MVRTQGRVTCQGAQYQSCKRFRSMEVDVELTHNMHLLRTKGLQLQWHTIVLERTHHNSSDTNLARNGIVRKPPGGHTNT
jgi:hypothetical protein